jgi:hypothetical protein
MTGIGNSLLSLIGACVLAALAAPATQLAPSVDRLISTDAAVVERARGEIVAIHKERVGALIYIIKDNDLLWNKPPTVGAAVQILGEMRAVEAAEPLAAIIGYPDIRPPGGPPFRQYVHRTPWPTPWWSAPDEGSVADSLLKIGRPCLPAVLTKLSETDSTIETELCLKVLFFLTDRDGAASALRAAGAGKEGAQAARLAKALESVKKAPERPEVPERLRAYVPRVD